MEVIAAVLFLDHTTGKPFFAKYYNPKLFSDIASKDAFEAKLGPKVIKEKPAVIACLIINDLTVHTRVSSDVVIAVVVENSDFVDVLGSELAQGLLDGATEICQQLTQPMISFGTKPTSSNQLPQVQMGQPLAATLDKAFCLANYERIALLAGEAVDSGIVLEWDGKILAKRVMSGESGSHRSSLDRVTNITSAATGGNSSNQSSFSSAFSFAKDRLTQAVMKQVGK